MTTDPDDTFPGDLPFPGPPIGTSARELGLMQFAPINYVIKPYVAPGLTILGGRPKIGKSVLALQWSLSVATNALAMGTCEVSAGSVMYLALEDNLRRLQQRLLQMSMGQPLPEGLIFNTEWPRLNAGGAEKLAATIARMSHPKLLMVDVQAKLRPVRSGRENLYDADYQTGEPLKKLADDYGIAVVSLHHTSKRPVGDDPLDSLSGSTGLAGVADAVMIMTRDTRGTVLLGRGRDISDFEVALKFDPQTLTYAALGDADNIRDGAQRNTIRAVLLKVAPDSLSPGEIAGLTGLPGVAVRKVLGRMVRYSEAELVARGRYVAVVPIHQSMGTTGEGRK